MEDEQQTSREVNKMCGVCGDRALGYNFNAVSCESCKAFFRRNALKNKDFRCPFTENCTITPVTRRFCQKCRLDKCLTIGMRKDYIMSEEDKALKRHKIEQNRAKKRRPVLNKSKEIIKARKSNFRREEEAQISLEMETSVSASTTSSVVSETYLWDTDKKYTELDSNSRQPVMDSMSPVTAASVPSPSSPPENNDIAGSKTLEMLKESPHPHPPLPPPPPQNCIQDSTSSVRFNLDSTEENLKFQVFQQTQGSKKLVAFGAMTMPTDSTEEEDQWEDEEEEEIDTKDEVSVCKKPMDRCASPTDLASRISQDPSRLTKLLTNPKLVARILEKNQDLLLKLIMDPGTIGRLTSDPQLSRFFQEETENMENSSNLSSPPCEVERENLENNGSSDNIIRDILAPAQLKSNPILTNLITNSRKEGDEDEKMQEIREMAAESVSSDWGKSTNDVTKDVLQDVQSIPIAANSIESILCEAIKLEFSAYSSFGGSLSSRELNDAERAKLNELIVANKALLAPLDDDITNLVGEECRFKGNSGQSDPVLLDVINLTAIAIRRLIKMSKKINAFKNMCQEDQLALLKGGCTEMMILRSAINYDPDKDMWKIPHSQERMSEIKADILKEAKGNLYTEHARFVRTFDPRWRDENIILILSAIALFTPDRSRVVHSDVIKLEQNSYYYLLRRYLESVYPGCEAKSMFLKLIRKISELHRLNDEVVGVYLNVNPSSVEPLLIEIFDLKH